MVDSQVHEAPVVNGIEYPKPPWGIMVLWGKRKVGKTIAALNSPWQPVHVIDDEFSAEDYENNMDMMLEMGIIKHPFTRASCLTHSEVVSEGTRFINEDVHYGTIILDTVGQITTWKADEIFADPKNLSKVNKMSQVVWGMVRDKLRTMLFAYQKRCDCLILTAHEREYKDVFSPRANPAVLELASTSIRLMRAPNQRIPTGILSVSRLPIFPPQIPEFSIKKMLHYVEHPANWKRLKKDEKVEEPIIQPQPEEE